MSGIKKILLVNAQGKTWPQAAARAGQLASRFHLPCVDGVTTPASWRGNAASAVLDMAERGGAGLIVCPASERHLVLERLAPSCALRIAGQSRAPVLLVNEKRAKAYRTVVVATDFSQASLSAAKTASALAPLAHFVFMHAYRLPDEGLMRELELPPRTSRDRHAAPAVAKEN